MRPKDFYHDFEVLKFVLVLAVLLKVIHENLPRDTAKDHEKLIEIGAAYHTSKVIEISSF
jgi:hypothetical protein